MDKSEIELQNSLGFVKNIEFITPKFYNQRMDIEAQINFCINDNLVENSISVKLPVLMYIMDVYFRKRISALKLGIKEIESSECCSIVLRFLDNKIYELQKNELQNIVKTQKSIKRNKINNLKLIDIWEPNSMNTKSEYFDVIKILMKDNSDINRPFVTKFKGKLIWGKMPGRNNYIAGFIQLCMKRGWILDKYSANQFCQIINSTFNVKVDSGLFKSVFIKEFKDKYINPFEFITKNN